MSSERAQGELIASKYRLERPLARGGMGSLWVARHVELDVEIAIKFSAMERGDAHDLRFRREARAAARLKSAHIVHVFDYGFDRGEPYIAMELLEGETLRELLDREGPQPLARTATLIAEVAKGLQVAHEAGIVHRDLKPSNLFLVRSGKAEVVKILDFGIAKASAETGSETAKSPDLGGDATRAGAIVGSPAYMSPEQARGELVDRRSDLWSLAVVAFRALTGAEPFTGTSAAETFERICSAPLPRVTDLLPNLPVELDGFFERGLARSKERRFQSAEELGALLSTLAGRHPQTSTVTLERLPAAALAGRTGETRPIEPRSGRLLRVFAAALVALVAAILGFRFWSSRSSAASASSASLVAGPPAKAPALGRASEPTSAVAPTAVVSAAEARAARPPARKLFARRPPQPATPAQAESTAPSEAETRELDPVFGLQR